MQSNVSPSARVQLVPVELLVCSTVLVLLLCLPPRSACLGQASSSLLSKMEKKKVFPGPNRTENSFACGNTWLGVSVLLSTVAVPLPAGLGLCVRTRALRGFSELSSPEGRMAVALAQNRDVRVLSASHLRAGK